MRIFFSYIKEEMEKKEREGHFWGGELKLVCLFQAYNHTQLRGRQSRAKETINDAMIFRICVKGGENGVYGANAENIRRLNRAIRKKLAPNFFPSLKR